MFVVSEKPTFTHDVEVRVPTDGGFTDQKFKATFEVMPTETFAEYNMSDAASSTEFLRAVVKHMDELVDRDERPVPYSDTMRDRLLNVPYLRSALARTYFKAVGGATLGN